jgi:predicted SnoaL-like aldol condensation-catalyzing enzyme
MPYGIDRTNPLIQAISVYLRDVVSREALMSAAQPISSEATAKQLVNRWFEEVWNQGRREPIFELFPAGRVIHDGSNDITGPEEFIRFYDSLLAQFSDFQIKPVVCFADDDLVCLRWSAAFRDKASGKSVHTTGTSVVRVENGAFAEAWQNWDAAGVESQLKG